MNAQGTTAIRIITVLAIVGVIVYVALNPDLVYRPTPKAVLFLTISCLPAILFASEAAAKFNLNLPGFAASAGGAAAIVFISLILLDRIARPEQYVAVFHLYDNEKQPLQGLERPGVVDVLPVEGGYNVAHFVDGNSIILIFPEQVEKVTLLVRPILTRPAQELVVSYDGKTQRNITLNPI